MKLWLDTHLLFWAAGAPDRLSWDFRSLIDDSEHVLLFSAASLWEVAIKRGLGRHDFKVDGRLLRGGLLDNGHRLPIVSDLVAAIGLADASVRSRVDGTGDRGGCHAAAVSRWQVSANCPCGIATISGSRSGQFHGRPRPR